MDFKEELKNRTAEVEKVVYKYLPDEFGEAKLVIEAANYSVKAGGKRLRPMLMQEVYNLFAKPDEAQQDEGLISAPAEILYRMMAAIEYIHTYSLIHDDLPAMDNDMLRRGMPTTHAKYGEAMAILAGDALLNYAYEIAISAVTSYNSAVMTNIGEFKSEAEYREGIGMSGSIAAAVQLLASKAGIYGMVGGQCVDVDSEKKGETITRQKLDYIYANKTGALIEAAMGVGALLGGASLTGYNTVLGIASRVGLAFQIRDDILDTVGDEATLGKPIGSDEKNEKATYVAFEGLEKAEEDVKRLTDEAVSMLESLPGDKEFLRELLLSLINRQK